MVALPNIVMLLPRYKHIGPGTLGRAPTPAMLLGAGRLRRRVGKPVKVGENACDQLLPAPILRCRGLGEERDEVSRLFGTLPPR